MVDNVMSINYYNFMNNKDLINKVGKKIKLLREDKKISQEVLGQLSKLERNSIGMIERGETNPTLCSLNQIATALGVDINELFDFTF